MSQRVLFRLMDSLEVDHVLNLGEKRMIISSNPDIRSMVFHMNHLVCQKGPEAIKKMMYCLRHIEPRLYGHYLVDEYKGMLMDLVGDVDIIINDLNVRGVAVSDEIKAIHNPKEKMSKVIDNLKSVEEKRIFYSVLEEREPQIRNAILMKMGTEPPYTHFEMVTAKWLTETATVAKDEWTNRVPFVSYDNDGCTWYSFICVPGKYECSVSGLRWTCKEFPLSFKYRFGQWCEYEDRIEALQYMPAGPLLDIKVTEGQFDEVYLPHWICTTVNPTILEKFAVLHSDPDGVSVEKVSEVTPTHVKLPHPDFSARGVLLRFWRRLGFPVLLKCKVLIYRTKKTFLTLHVYLIPSDSALEEEIHKKAEKKGYESIDKPYPHGTLQMDDQFKLKSEVDCAAICPHDFRLTYESRDPNYFEVFIRQPGDEFTLKLENAAGPVWSCVIRHYDYSVVRFSIPEVTTYDAELLRVRSDFAARVSPEVTKQLLDNLLGVHLNNEEKNAIMEKNSTQADRARALIDTIRPKGPEASRRMIFHLEHRDPTLHSLLRLPHACTMP
ncbi:NACHT, LRR and PYD domains-containing protein 1b allele 3-like isoform X1 [Festucalex cinctus]